MADKELNQVNPDNLVYLASQNEADPHELAKKELINFGKVNFQKETPPKSFNRSANDKPHYKVFNTDKQLKVRKLIEAYREYGHLRADINPLDPPDNTITQQLELAYHGLDEEDFNRRFIADGLNGMDKAKLPEILSILQTTYCGTIGFEYGHILSADEKAWLQKRIESPLPEIDDEKKKWLLQRLSAAETFEQFLHIKYVGQKRFGLEGGESLIPLLSEIIEALGEHKAQRLVLGMAHRGRLNVLVNIFGKPADLLFAEFAGDFELSEEQTGDVKYHLGFSSLVKTKKSEIRLTLLFNPSHLELVNPVVTGHARFHQDKLIEANKNKVAPVLIHGDASFSGQGIVMEALNMSQARGYSTRGTIHIIINNQIGFTTSLKEDIRSTHYCTDVAKMVDVPIFHVNAEDIEAVMRTTRLAVEYRMQFQKDVVIDLICYRRHGHNEADEPSITQPMMYKKIKAMETTYKTYAKKLINDDLVSQKGVDNEEKKYRANLEKGKQVALNIEPLSADDMSKAAWEKYFDRQWTEPYQSAITAEEIIRLNNTLLNLPKDFEPHPRVMKVLENREKMAYGKLDADWGFAETLAYASLVDSGIPIRLSGEDVGRGTFSHRHAILLNQKNGDSYIPLKHLHKNQGEVQIINSILSEEAVLGFEYGYATANPDALVIWEAQFGDFANGAQAVIDQFIMSAETKWGRLSGLVLMLPHGLEGQGPEHSSARLERYLQGCARYNVQVCVPSTASQIFHLLRRQMCRPFRKPLIILTPKSLLRNKFASSPLYKFTDEQFNVVIGEQYENIEPKNVTRILMCSGKVFYDLLTKRQEDQINHVAILRIEQLYPFSLDALTAELKKFPNVTEFVWVQEEPINQGAWYTTRHNFVKTLGDNSKRLQVVARALSSAPAEGNMKLYKNNQELLIEQAFGIKPLPTF